MRAPVLDRAAAAPAPEAGPRLLAGLGRAGGPVSLDEHLSRWGRLDLRRCRHLIDEVERSGLTGRGGAAFPVAAKWRSVRGGVGRRVVVVANGAEGEPASAKDATLLSRTPHLVLDGASAAAAALGAGRVVVYAPARFDRDIRRAVEERSRRNVDPVPVEIICAPEAFLSGQETAVVNALNGRPEAIPYFQGLQPVRERGVAGRPTLVQNVETLAHVALIARFGAPWFRGTGTERFPGTTLLTVSGRYGSPVVIEAPLGARLADVLKMDTAMAQGYHGALLGGYGGTWISMKTLLELELTEDAARERSATLGPGVVALLPTSVCPLAEVARVVRYMAAQSAGQCGPCVHGLAALDEAVHALAADPRSLRGQLEPIFEICSLVEGRGACRHPDGVARFVRSALTVFSAEAGQHLQAGPCPLVGAHAVLPFGGPRPARSLSREQARR